MPKVVVRLAGGLTVVVLSFWLTLVALDWMEGSPLNVLEATYGANCGRPAGNVTEQVKNICAAGTPCTFLVDVNKLGDPAPGCIKEFSVKYRCERNAPPKIGLLAPEAHGKKIILDCKRS